MELRRPVSREKHKIDLNEEKAHSEALWEGAYNCALEGNLSHLVEAMRRLNVVEYKILKKRREENDRKIANIRCDPNNSETKSAEEKRKCLIKMIEELNGNT